MHQSKIFMEDLEFARRQFLKQAAIGIGGIGLQPVSSLASHIPALDPDKTAAGKMLTIVCVGAHPGDPEFGCGGTLAKYSAAGHRVVIIYLTRGEAGDPKKTFAESAALRTREAEAASAFIQAKTLFAGQVDANTELNKSWAIKLKGLILAEKPDIVLTQWPVDTHPDHQVTGLLTLTVWSQSGRAFDLYFYEVNTGSESLGFNPTDYVDISAQRELKKKMMFAHQTQAPQETYDDFFKIMEEFRGLEAGVKAAEAFVHFKPATTRASIAGL